MSLEDLTTKQREEVDAIRVALEQELRDSTENTTSKAAVRDLEDLKMDFLAAIKQVVKFSTNDTLKTKIAMWGYDRLIADGKANADPLAEIMAGMERAKAAQTES
jgi:protein tyrosine/serine phosphatase